MIERFLIALWAAILSFFVVYGLGSTHILSSVIAADYIAPAIDILFVVIAILFVFILWKIVPRRLSPLIKVAAFLPPLLYVCWLFIML